MKSFTLEQIAQITGGLLSKAEDVTVTKIALSISLFIGRSSPFILFTDLSEFKSTIK